MAAARKLWHEWWGGGGCWRLHCAQEEPCGAQRRWESARAGAGEAMRMGCGAEKLRGSGFSGVKKMCFTLELGGAAPAWGWGNSEFKNDTPGFGYFEKI